MRRLIWTFAAALLAGPTLGAEQAPPAPGPNADAALDEPEPADDSRLLLFPTGRPLRKDTGYFSDHYLFFPGFSYGVTENISLSAVGGPDASLTAGVGAFRASERRDLYGPRYEYLGSEKRSHTDRS